MCHLQTWRALIFTGFFAAVFPNAVDENNKFCIRTEPMLLADIENHVNPNVNDPHCGILATTLTAKEKENFMNTMCKDHGKASKDDFQYFKLRNGELDSRQSYHEICNGNANPLLAWVPYEMILHNFAQELDPKERTRYIAKATDLGREKTDLCYFKHADIVNNISPNLFTCVVMISEDNFYGLDSNINVLVEILPIMYEIRNVSYVPWSNVTQSYKTMVGKSGLKNPSRYTKQIYGSIDYAYVEKIMLNMSSVYGNSLEKLPILFEHKGVVLDLDEDGLGGITVKDKAFFGRSMDSKTTVKVDVIGQWAEHRQQFSADIYEYFGYGIKRFRNEMHDGIATFTLIESTEPVYESPDSSLLTRSTVHLHKNGTMFERLTDDDKTNHTDSPVWEKELNDLSSNGHPYPGFYPWFVAGALIVGLVLLIVVYGMVRSCSKREEKQKYKFTGI